MPTFQSRLLTWYRRHRRRLPWRDRPEPYRVWVSELMLQQTQVGTVIPYYERFIERFPDVESLASASEQEVLACWSGLGYYRRAKALHRSARIIVAERSGRLPDDIAGWVALPGVGRYTAGAIVSIAYGKRAPILDGNVARVLARIYGIRGNVKAQSTERELWRLAEEILPQRSVGDFNQALMELGALVCTKSSPKCLVCPLRSDCVAVEEGLEQILPDTGPKPRAVSVTMGAALVERDDQLLLFRRTRSTLMQDLWELPSWECAPGELPATGLVRESRLRYGVDLTLKGEIACIRHSIMNRRIRLHAFEAELRGGVAEEHRWVGESQIASLPVSSIVHKILHARSEGRVKRATS